MFDLSIDIDTQRAAVRESAGEAGLAEMGAETAQIA